MGKAEVKLSWLTDHMILHVENLIKFLKNVKVLELISEFLEDQNIKFHHLPKY